MSFNHGTVWWNELMTRDVPAAKRYYSEMCGWSFDEMPMMGEDNEVVGTYCLAMGHNRPLAGITDMSSMEDLTDAPALWMTYLAVDDMRAALDQTKTHGGKVLRAPFDVPGVGRISMIQDPGGALLGIMTPEPGAQTVEPDDGDFDNMPV